MIAMAVGDVLVDRADPGSAFAEVLPVLRRADVLFGNCEAVYSSTTVRAPSAGIAVVVDPSNAAALGDVGFDVVSCANNHVLDGGYEGLADTLEGLRIAGVGICGAGPTREAAWAPTVVETDAGRVAFLAFSCVYPAGYAATEDRPGIAGIRVHQVPYESGLENVQSGVGMPTFTVANPIDVTAVEDAVAAARDAADNVLVSFHWGDGSRPHVVLDYETQLARAAADAGATAVVGHHHHMLRGVEWHRGVPIFYGLCHFVFDVRDFDSLVGAGIRERLAGGVGEYGYRVDPAYPLLPMHPDARMTAIAVLEIDGSRVRPGLIPCELGPDGVPRPLPADSERAHEVVRYVGRSRAPRGTPVELVHRGWQLEGIGVYEAVAEP